MFLHPCCLVHFQEHWLSPGAGQSIEVLLFRKVALIGVEATAIEILLRYSFISFFRTATTGGISYDVHIWSNLVGADSIERRNLRRDKAEPAEEWAEESTEELPWHAYPSEE